ncbi:MAG: hypothetical protein E6R03_03840 [Hyphomicrobiaceae bacterium]|nr:MAG: hypothetical protein E6R03_03840 [Hyphomicrobiaceae bacterium]
MSLTTRAKVLQTLNLTDDATTYPALAIAIDPATLTQAVFTVNADQTTLTVTPTPGSPTTFTLTNASYDTMTELATGVEALAGIECNAVAVNSTTLASTLLDASQSVTLTGANALGQLTYSNVAAGSIAAFIDQLIDDVDAEIERYTGRTFDSATYTETYDGTGTPLLQLNQYPVSSITSISYIDDAGNAQAYPANSYRFESSTGRVQLNTPGQGFGGGGGTAPAFTAYGGYAGDGGLNWNPAYTRGWLNAFPEGFQNVRAVYVGGYATVPADLSRVATEMVVDLYLNRRTNPRASGESVTPVTVSFMPMSDLILKYAQRLGPFRRPTC